MLNVFDQLHLEEIKRNPNHLLEISNPSKELKQAAIHHDIRNLHYIKDPDKELELIAMQLFLESLRYKEERLKRSTE